MNLRKLVAKRIRTAREAKHWSQADLAKATRLNQSAVSHFETGRRMPCLENLLRLCTALDRSADYIIGRFD